MFRCGLIVGKFSPLHRGHEFLIESALRSCEHLVLLTYSNPELPGCSAERREQWLAQLYPQTTRLVVSHEWLAHRYGGELSMPRNDAADDEHRAFVQRLLREELRLAVDAVFTSESYGPGFAEHLQRGAPAGRTVKHVLVDAGRVQVPVSASFVRADVHARRDWLSPAVYATFVERVAVLGGESSGKSTLARDLAQELGSLHCPEYGRELWMERSGELQLSDMLAIARQQVEREDRLAERCNRYLVCDTSPLTTLFYSRDLFGTAAPELEALARRPYAHTILCAPDIPFHQDGTRRDATFRAQQQTWYERELSDREIPYLALSGDPAARVAGARAFLRSRG
jgi:HTH-type transcriptional regulator, transcriptional repressor of NAD biosynthesis genes